MNIYMFGQAAYVIPSSRCSWLSPPVANFESQALAEGIFKWLCSAVWPDLVFALLPCPAGPLLWGRAPPAVACLCAAAAVQGT